MFNKKDPMIQNTLPRIKKILKDPNVRPWFIATRFLKDLLVKDDPRVAGMVPVYKKLLLQGNGLLMEEKMLFQYIEGTLDEKNTFMLDNSDNNPSISHIFRCLKLEFSRIFLALPVLKLSMTNTSRPISSRASTRLTPTKPQPPTTRILIFQFLLIFSISPNKL